MTNEKMMCPVCDEGELVAGTYADDFKHNNGTVHVEGLEYCLCTLCGADPVLSDQVRRNHLKVADAKRAKEGLLTGQEILAIREALGLTQQAASELFGGGANAFSKYERGDVIQSAAMDKLLRLVAMQSEILDLLKIAAGIEVHHEVAGYRTASPVKLIASARNYFPKAQGTKFFYQNWSRMNGAAA